MKCLTLFISVLLMLSCSKDEDNNDVKTETELILTSGKWNRVSMILNPHVLLPKQDGSGDFFTLTDLMKIKDLEGYDRDFKGYYTFNEDGTYTVTSVENKTEGNYSLAGNVITAINSKNQELEYSIRSITDSDIVMELPMIFFGQETTVEIYYNKL